MSACVSVCMYVQMCVYVCLSTCVYVSVSACICVIVCMHACVHVCLYVCVCVSMYACVCARICVYAHVSLCVCRGPRVMNKPTPGSEHPHTLLTACQQGTVTSHVYPRGGDSVIDHLRTLRVKGHESWCQDHGVAWAGPPAVWGRQRCGGHSRAGLAGSARAGCGGAGRSHPFSEAAATAARPAPRQLSGRGALRQWSRALTELDAFLTQHRDLSGCI